MNGEARSSRTGHFFTLYCRHMTEYVAFLRGINVGGNSVIKMEDLGKVFAKLGFSDVRTVLASGNVLFEVPRRGTKGLSHDIADALRKKIGKDVTVVVRSVDDLRALAARRPFKDAGAGFRPFVTLISEDAGKGSLRTLPGDDFRILSVEDGIICSTLRETPGIGTVDLMAEIERAYGSKVTTRTWGTIEKILKLADS